MRLKTNVFKICRERGIEPGSLVKDVSLPPGYIKKIERGEAEINHIFIIESMKAFPDCRTGELFFLAN